MTSIKKLNLALKSGLLSDLQSDTIFGHFAWRLKDLFGNEKLAEFLKLYEDDKPVFTISDGFLEKEGNTYFPKPLKITPPVFSNNSKIERIQNFLEQKESKNIKLITLKELNYYLQGEIAKYEESLLDLSSSNFPGFNTDLRVSVEIDRSTFASKEGQLFSYDPMYLSSDTTFVLFIKIIDLEQWNHFNCEQVLKALFEIGFGKKKSSGYGEFEVISFEDFNGFTEAKEPNGFISLSNYLPANNDQINDSFYEINVKYGKLGEEFSKSQNPFKKPIILFKPGSCFLTNENKDFYGRVTRQSEINDYKPNVIQNGIAFTLRAVL